MVAPQEHEPGDGPPTWAMERASAELYDTADQAMVIDRAWQIARDTATQYAERHDEYDDPDRGGEG